MNEQEQNKLAYDAWVYGPGRTEVFQEWLDSLESRAVRRIRPQVDGVRRHLYMNKGHE